MPDRVAFYIGSIPVYWYGIMIMLGVLLASYLAFIEARRRGEDPDNVWQLFPWVLVLGIAGARLGWVISEANNYPFNSILDVVNIRQGGLSIQGAVVGGALAVIGFCRRQRLSFFKWADIIVPGLALAQAVGRWGNFFNQEAFGRPTTLPWGIPIDVARQAEVAGPNPGFTPSSDLRFHPTFAYEMIWDLLNFALLMWLGRQRRIRLLQGDLLWVYLIFYSMGRFFIEEIRVDSATVSGFKTPQLVAIITILVALAGIAVRHRPGGPAHLAEANLPPTAPPRRRPAAGSRLSRVRRVERAQQTTPEAQE